MPTVYFYIPHNEWPAQEVIQLLAVDDIGIYLQPLGIPSRVGTIYNWVLQTYLRLKDAGFPCTLVGTLPTEGIVITYWESLPIDLKPSAKLLIVSILADGFYPHPYTQLRIVQNRQQVLSFDDCYFMPHWPQPGLIPRNSNRGDRFENIGYFGATANLSAELMSSAWQVKLADMGLNWQVVEPGCWHDYSNIDAVLAVRSFQKIDYSQKPATKLFNAWHAGVPAILGCESAFQAERKSELDYVEVASLDELLVALQRLRDDPQLRQNIIANGHVRSEETSIKNLTAQWGEFITQIAIPAYEDWCTTSYLTQNSLFVQRFIKKKINGVNYRFLKYFSALTNS